MGVNKKYLFLKRLKDVNYIIILALICYFFLHRIIEIVWLLFCTFATK
jgi:hypothetical protein